jgi:lysophospholipase L1-like esterase
MFRLFALLVLLLPALVSCSPASAAEVGPRPPRYVAIGASDSVGVGAADPDHDGWVPRFYAHLPSGSTLVNLGISGSTLHEALVQQLPVALDAQPDLVTVWLAVNDFDARVSLDKYGADLDTMLTELDGTGATVLVGNLPDLRLLPRYSGIDPQLLGAALAAWNRVIADVTGRHHAVLVDLNPTWQEIAQHPEFISADGFHPSSAGYARLAEVFWTAYVAAPVGGSARG